MSFSETQYHFKYCVCTRRRIICNVTAKRHRVHFERLCILCQLACPGLAGQLRDGHADDFIPLLKTPRVYCVLLRSQFMQLKGDLRPAAAL